MSDTTPADLTIPPDAAEAWFACGCSESGIRSGYKPEAVPLIVAAELRRLAEEIGDRSSADNTWWFMDVLTDRANELDGGCA